MTGFRDAEKWQLRPFGVQRLALRHEPWSRERAPIRSLWLAGDSFKFCAQCPAARAEGASHFVRRPARSCAASSDQRGGNPTLLACDVFARMMSVSLRSIEPLSKKSFARISSWRWSAFLQHSPKFQFVS
jgi:hypothetical protein